MPYSVPEFAKSDTIASSASLATGATSTTLTSGNFTRTGTQHYVVDYNNAKREVISATVSGTAMTSIVRGLDGTTDQDHAANAPIISSLVPSAYQQVVDAVSGVSAANGWSSMSGTQTYASGTTMNTPAGGLLVYAKGDKIKLNQSIPLTSYWALDSSSADTKGSNNGTDTAVSYATDGKFGKGATFTAASSSKIVITDAANLQLGKTNVPFTFGGWFKTGTAGTTKGIFQSYSANTNNAGLKIYVTSANKIGIIFANNTGTSEGANFINPIGTTTVTDNALHYLVITYQSNFFKVYLDGVLEMSGYCVTPAYAATNYVRIGCDNNTGTDANFMNGLIDDVFLINGFAVDSAYVAAKYAAATAQTNANITATQYAYVTNVADTLLTITGGADYVLYNGAITDAYYSKAMSPVGFPGGFNNVSANNISGGYSRGRFTINGRIVQMRTVTNIVSAMPASPYIELPVSTTTVDANGSWVGEDTGNATYTGTTYISSATPNKMFFLNPSGYVGAAAPFTWGSTDILKGSIAYEI